MAVNHVKVAASSTPFIAARRTWLLPALTLLVVLAAGLLFWYRYARVITASAPVPVTLKTIQVQRGDIEQAVLATGKLQLHKYADVGVQVSGQINDMLVTVGDEVKAGKLLLTIEPTLSTARFEGNQAQLARLHAELAEQQAQLDFAELQFKRQTQLKAENATREEALEASRTARDSAAARMDAINARIRQAESTIKEDEEIRKHTEVTAPISGTVVSLSVRPGQMVNASQQMSALMRIADLSKLTVQARVAEIDVPRLHKGMTAYFTTPGYPGKRWSGKLRQIIPIPAEDSGEQGKETFYNALFEVNNPERQLMSGMSAQVSFVLDHAHDATIAPISVLGKPDGDGLYTVTVTDAKRQTYQRKVRVGIRNQQQAQVLSGLTPGEQVVLNAPAAAAQNPRAPVAHSAGNAVLSPKGH